MNDFQQALEKNKFLILDGAVATELEKKGADLNDPLWSAKVLMEQPELIKETHLDYLEAGADILSTTTYQATFEGFASKGLDYEKSKSLFELSVQLAKEAREIYLEKNVDRKIFIAASIGPYGAYLADGSEYTGKYLISKEGLKAFHRKRLKLLIDLGVDLLLFETFPNLTETIAIGELLNEFHSVPALFSFSCSDEHHLRDGSTIEDAATVITSTDSVFAIGVNCISPDLVSPILSNLKDFHVPLLAYPNSGDQWDAQQKCWIEKGNGSKLIDFSADWVNNGAQILGGCCRTSPQDIKELWQFRRQMKNADVQN